MTDQLNSLVEIQGAMNDYFTSIYGLDSEYSSNLSYRAQYLATHLTRWRKLGTYNPRLAFGQLDPRMTAQGPI